MAITRSSSTPSHVPKKSSKMGLKSVANRNKGKRPVVQDDDSDFAPQMSKRERVPPKKKSNFVAYEKISHDLAQKNDQDGAPLRSQDWVNKFSHNDFYRSKCVYIPGFVFHPQVVHSLLLREVYQPNPKEFWAKVAGRCIRFNAEEFYLITSLDCFGDCNKLLFSQESNQLIEVCFPGIKTIDHKAIEDAFLGSRWGQDESLGLKLSVLYFIECFLLTNTPDKEVSRFDLDVIDSGRWDEYCWGRESFELTIDSFKGRIEHGIKMKNKKEEKGGQSYDGWYRALGCPWVFIVWFYEWWATAPPCRYVGPVGIYFTRILDLLTKYYQDLSPNVLLFVCYPSQSSKL
ncbi:hypothetical protein CsatB_001396 [Cannabis sativa]